MTGPIPSPHAHDHGTATAVAEQVPGYYDMLENAVQELLIDKQLITAQEIRRQIEVLDSRTPALGAKVIARAWLDEAFKARLLANGRAACEELGISFYDDTSLIVLENTPEDSQPHCLYPLFLLPAACVRPAAGLVQIATVSCTRGIRASQGLG